MLANTNKFSIYFFIFYFLSSSVFGFNLCGVDISEPWFLINDSSGTDIFIVDSDGDIYFSGESHTLNNLASVDSFQIGSMFFNEFSSFFTLSNFHDKLSSFSDTSGLVIMDNSDNIVSVFNDNSISTKGVGVFEDSQSNCLSDGNYCNLNDLEYRNYFCDISGDKIGSCTYSVISFEDCLSKLTTDSDGSNYFTRGTVVDYTGCLVSSCTYSTHVDSCSGDTLTEYLSSGSSYTQSLVNCNSYEYNYCVGDSQIWRDNWACGSGSCIDVSDSKVQDCSVSATTYSSWSCSGDFQRVKVETSYSPTCSGASCGETSTSTNIYESAPSGYYCSGGNWVLIQDCDGYWDYYSGSCSVSCGGGNYDKSWVITTSPSIGGASCPSPSWYDNAGASCNTQSCCISHYTEDCLAGGSNDGYWFDSCGNREGVSLDCAPDQYCTNSFGSVRCHTSENN